MRKWLLLSVLPSLFLNGACGRMEPSKSGTKHVEASERSRYPIVLAHGFLGFDKILFVDYFYGIPALLRAKGYDVHVTHVSPINTIAFRAHQLASQIDQILTDTGAEKVNIIGHSMGGLDARHLVSAMGYGDRVASITSIATPHHGSEIADAVQHLTGPFGPLHEALLTLMGVHPDGSGGWAATAEAGGVDLPGNIWNLTTDFAEQEFNPTHPDDPRVFYQSYGGGCPLDELTNPDWVSSILSIPYNYISTLAGENDGIVSVKSARHGVDRGMFPAHHLDEVGQLFGHETFAFDYRQFYAGVAAELAAKGL